MSAFWTIKDPRGSWVSRHSLARGYMVIQNPATITSAAAATQTSSCSTGHSSRYQRLSGSHGSMGFGCLYMVILSCCAAAVNVASPTGFEPVAYSLEGCCSILLS